MILVEVFIIDNRYSIHHLLTIISLKCDRVQWTALPAIVPARILPTSNEKQNRTLEIAQHQHYNMLAVMSDQS